MQIHTGVTRNNQGGMKISLLPCLDIFIVRPGWMLSIQWLCFYAQFTFMP